MVDHWEIMIGCLKPSNLSIHKCIELRHVSGYKNGIRREFCYIVDHFIGKSILPAVIIELRTIVDAETSVIEKIHLALAILPQPADVTDVEVLSDSIIYIWIC